MPDAATLDARLKDASPEEILQHVLRDVFPGGVAAVSSFGTESAVLLHMVARIEPRTPVLFLETGMLFSETLAYRDTLVKRLGLTDVRVIRPEPQEKAAEDPEDSLWAENPDACCALRKVRPLERALAGFHASLNGRKRYHGDERAHIPVVETDGARLKVNPLARLDRAALQAYFTAHDLPRHPLERFGFASVGCMPCTSRVAEGEDLRAGRWRGQGKTECGIHIPQKT